MKAMVRGLMCAGVLCVSVSMARGEDAVAPAGQDEIAQLQDKIKGIDKKIGEIRAKAAAIDEVKALKQKVDEAQKALTDARKGKLAADANYGAAVKAAADADAKVKELGLKDDGLPKDPTKVLGDQDKAAGEAAVKTRKESRSQVAAIEKALNESEEIRKLDQAMKDARKAHDEALSAKIAADPESAALKTAREELQAKISAAKKAAAEKK